AFGFRVAVRPEGLSQGFVSLRLVVFDPDDALLDLQCVAQDHEAADHLLWAFAHQSIVAGDVRLALGAIEYQRFHHFARAGIELDEGGETRATQAYNAGLADQVA